MMTAKQIVAEAVLQEIQPDMVLGIGTGSTVNCLIDLLPTIATPKTIVSSSVATTARLSALGITVVSINDSGPLDLYIDGADQVVADKVAIKGKGGAHTLEKILATQSKTFVGMITEDKLVKVFSAPIPIEVMPQARTLVVRELLSLGADPQLREGRTEHDNIILDVYGLGYDIALEEKIKQIPGVIESGLFSKRRFDKVYVERSGKVEIV